MTTALPRSMTFVGFAEGVLRLRLTLAQRVLCRVAFDDVDPSQLQGEERELALQIFGAVEDIGPLARRLLVLRLGRGSGKSTVAAAYAIYVMLFADLSSCGPGDVPAAVTIAPTKKTAGIAVRIGRELVRGVPALDRLVESETTEGFTLRRHDGKLVSFAVYAASKGGAAARGLTLLCFILDEAEFFASADEYAVTDRDVYRSMVPRLKGKGIFISTPWPSDTLMGELWEQNFGTCATALAAKATSSTMRPDDADLAANIATERARDPENAAREFDCESTGMLGSSLLFDPQTLVADPGLIMPADVPYGWKVGCGVDLGLTRDAAAQVFAASLTGRCSILFCRELRPAKGAPLKLSEVVATFAGAPRSTYRVTRWCADSYAREPAKEYTEPYGISIVPAPSEQAARAATWLRAKKLAAEGRLALPPPPCPLIGQLRTVIAKPAAGGIVQVTIPRRRDVGRHGDLAAAAILAIHESMGPQPARGMVTTPLGLF
jgi:hypothetical protein